MEHDSQKNNFGNEALIQILRERGAETIFKMTIKNHRLPSINKLNAGSHWQRKNIKDQEKAKFATGSSSTAIGQDYWTQATQA